MLDDALFTGVVGATIVAEDAAGLFTIRLRAATAREFAGVSSRYRDSWILRFGGGDTERLGVSLALYRWSFSGDACGTECCVCCHSKKARRW